MVYPRTISTPCANPSGSFRPLAVAYDYIEADPEHDQGEYFDVFIFRGTENLTYEVKPQSRFRRAEGVARTHHYH
jgi:hypothetical protein